jgi:hypothetical protein
MALAVVPGGGSGCDDTHDVLTRGGGGLKCGDGRSQVGQSGIGGG